MPNQPSLALARRIVKAYLLDDFHLFIIYGDPRIGKSAYAIKSMGQAIDYLFGEDIYNPRICQKYMGWDPNDNVQRWWDLEKRIPTYTWDDAGYWLFSLNWTDPLLQSVQRYWNVIGTDINCPMLTTPDPGWILSKIANIPGTIRVKIIKRYGGKSDAPSVRFARKAIGYQPYRSPDLKKHGVNKVLTDDFSCKLPEEFYRKWYQPTREHYARQTKMEMRKELRRRMEKGGEKRGRPKKDKSGEEED